MTFFTIMLLHSGYRFFRKGMYLGDAPPPKKKVRRKLLSESHQHQSSSILPIYELPIKGGQKVNLLSMVAITIRLKFGGCVDGTKWIRTIPHLGGRTIGEGLGGGRGWCLHHHHHAAYRELLSQLSTNLVGKVTAPEVFCTCRTRSATAHAHNTLFLYLGKTVGQRSPNLEYWVSDMGGYLSHFMFKS